MLAEFEKGLMFGEGFQEVGLSPDWVYQEMDDSMKGI